MALLLIDTAGARCAALVRADGGADVLRAEEIGRGHDKRLAAVVNAALAEADILPAQITRIGVVVGPGSFTGVRVGAAFGRGMAAALGIETVGVHALDALGAQMEAQPLSAALHDAKRNEVVWRAYEHGRPITELVTQPADAAAAALAELMRARAVDQLAVAGSGAALIEDMANTQEGAPAWPSMAALADLAEKLDPASAPAAPAYHRPPDAAPMKKPRKPGGAAT